MRHGRLLALLLPGLLVTGVVGAPRVQARSVKATLTPTVAAPGSAGRAVVSARNARGKFTVLGRHLAPFTTFQVVVGGIPIGTLVTGGTGTGRARFSTTPGGKDQPLGVDPRGEHVTVHEMEDGEDALEGDVPDDSDPNDVRCCLQDDDESECEDRTEAECLAEGGVSHGLGSCLPDPCGDMTQGELVRCCEADDHARDGDGLEDGVSDGEDDDGEDDDGEAECELRTATSCGEHHGTSMGPGSCDSNPCAPVGGEAVRCCLPEEHDGPSLRHDDGDEGSELECEHLTHQHCVDAGGTDMGMGSCEPDPCVPATGTPTEGTPVE